MSDNSKIEWLSGGATWQIITGCSLASPGCIYCYAQTLAGGRLRNHESRTGLTQMTKNGPIWNGQVRFNEKELYKPLQWRRPRKIFPVAHGDLFHENVPDEWIDKVFAVMALASHHTFIVLTKRAKRMREYMNSIDNGDGTRIEGLRDALIEGMAQKIYHERTGENPDMWLAVSLPLKNVWLGVSCEDQRRYNEREFHLRMTPAAVRFFSFEPLLGPIKAPWLGDWAIIGGESGAHARPMHPDWARSLMEQCEDHGVPKFFKQWGAWLPWEPAQAPLWRSQNGIEEDRHILFPSDFDTDKNWDDGLWAIGYGQDESHVAFQRVGKKKSGNFIDGIQHLEWPS